MAPHRQAQQFPYIEVTQAKRSFLLTAIPADLLTRISYAAIRRQDEEEGAVQRVLNQGRIAGVKAFALGDGDFPASIVLNWVSSDLEIEDNFITIPDHPRAAQIIDGQHRVAGLKDAISERAELATQILPVAIYRGLNTVDCANIFLSINTEQRPVSRSLVFDLYGIASEDLVDQAAVRARDIAMSLDGEGQAYYNFVKLPNQPRQRGGIALSTAVSAIKPLVESKGVLEQIGATSLETQRHIFQNFFTSLANSYGERWQEKDNAFLYAAGFMGAVEFLQLKLIPYCVMQKSFKMETITAALRLDRTDLIRQEEMKGIGGKDAPRKVFERLLASFQPDETIRTTFEV